jgi:DNA-binding NarL/FixJ family response regulator
MCRAETSRYAYTLGGIVARILIADDRESMRNALKTLLALRSDWVVCGEAQDADEALTKAAELRPDLVLLDYKLHHSDGLTAADGILRAMPEVPIVMFTLYKTDELAHAANLMGIRRVIGKEEDVNTLLHAIETELNSPSLR